MTRFFGGVAAGAFTTECSQEAPEKWGGAKILVQKEHTTNIQGESSLVRKVGTGAAGAHPDL